MEKKQPHKLILRIDDLCTLDALTEVQKEFFHQWDKHSVHVLFGTAGTGKTFISMYKALEEVFDKGNEYEQLIVIRSAVSARDIGALPGGIDEKGMIYELPYFDACNALFNRKDAYERAKEQNKIHFALTSFLRGLTFDNSIIIVDEIQNCKYVELYSIITRVGENSKIVFCGDFKQTDIKDSGLHKFLSVLKCMRYVNFCEFTVNDIVRSDLVKQFIIAEERYEKDN